MPPVSSATDRSADPFQPENSQSPGQTKSTADVVANGNTGDAKENMNLREQSSGSKPSNTSEAQSDEVDDFGLPIRVRARPVPSASDSEHDNPLESERKNADAEEKPSLHVDTGAADGAQSVTPDIPAPGSHIPLPPGIEGGSLRTDHDAAEADAHARRTSVRPSEFSHQRLTEDKADDESESEEEWRAMPALGEFDYYDDFGRLVARGAKEDDNDAVYRGLGGAGKGYTRVQLDEDAQSATSMDEDTGYLFKEAANNSIGVEDEEPRDPVSQLQATKDLLTESQRIAYVGVTRLAMHQMLLDFEKLPLTKGTRKTILKGMDAMKKWNQAMMARLYAHMEIDSAEQLMIEQLAEHGVEPADLVPPLMHNARVKNPLAEEEESTKEMDSPVDLPAEKEGSSPTQNDSPTDSPAPKEDTRSRVSSEIDRYSASTPPPPYTAHEEDLPEVRTPSQLPESTKIDIDLRWTVLCDLFLVLIADSSYDSRSRTLLERVGKAMEVSWIQIARFEKRVIDALEMQEEADKETWDESEHMEKRRKLALKRKYMVMGIATVGGGLVIGLSAGLLAPVIGAGMAAGLGTIGVGGTSAFLGGAGGTALIASGATLTGGTIGLRASHRRTGAVKTFEYRPLHNNKKVNLIVTVAGWMTGKVDDVRLPYSTVDPIMGDLYSVLWEPEMLQSMGDTINILATEVSVIL